MDFTFTEEQQSVRELADKVFAGQVTVERVKEVERSADRFDRDLWAALAQSGLVAIALPEEAGGSGLGMTELCLVLEQHGRRVAPVPLLWSSVAALAVARFAPPALRAAVLPGVVSGESVLTCGLEEAGTVTATPADGGWVLSGTRLCVPWAHVATRVLIAATAGTSTVLALIDPAGEGVHAERAEATDRQIVTHLTFDRAACDVVAGAIDGATAVRWVTERALTGLCALQLGVAEEALAQAALYTSTRKQFGRPLSTFQSTSARAADAYIDTEAIRVTLWQAAWRLDRGLDASTEVEVAKWWASEAGQRVVHATQHMHGGIGADVDYPIHRYFLWGKQIEDTLGGGSSHLARIGAALADTGIAR